jgi:hypothetical protein
MYATTEVRWFIKGSVPENVRTWFGNWNLDSEEKVARLDYYLRITDSDALGVKLREGMIEMKQRLGKTKLVRINQHTTGCMESWRKWSFPLNGSIESTEILLDRSPRWIGIRKERSLRTFQSRNGSLEQVPGLESSSSDCGWELTAVKIAGIYDQWWSMGFEANDGEEEGKQTLISVAERVLSSKNAPRFRYDDSFGYPRWLQQVDLDYMSDQ